MVYVHKCKLLFVLVPRFFASLDILVPVSSLKVARFRFCRKNFSGKNEKLANLSVISSVRVDAIVDGNVAEVDSGVDDMPAAVVGGIAVVASGRTPTVDEISAGRTRAGFLINDRNKCRHRSSGISELSTSNSRNCRKP